MDASYCMRKILPLLTELQGGMTPRQVEIVKQFEVGLQTVILDERRQSEWNFAQDINGY